MNGYKPFGFENNQLTTHLKVNSQMTIYLFLLNDMSMSFISEFDYPLYSKNTKNIFTNMEQETIVPNGKEEQKDWTKVLFEVILKILTLGFYHIEKHRKDK